MLNQLMSNVPKVVVSGWS